MLQTLATDRPRARAAIGATSPLTTVGCTLIFLLVLSVLTRLLRPKLSPWAYKQHTVDPDSLIFADDDLPALRPDQLKSAIAALKQHAREHALLEAGALLRQVRRAVSTAPHTPAAKASRAALEGEIVPGLTADELAQRHAECLHTLQILDPLSPATGWRELSSHDDMTSCYVRRSADGAVWAKATAELRGVRLADLVTIFRQTELFDRWYPRCVASENLKVPGAVERLFRMVVQVRDVVAGPDGNCCGCTDCGCTDYGCTEYGCTDYGCTDHGYSDYGGAGARAADRCHLLRPCAARLRRRCAAGARRHTHVRPLGAPQGLARAQRAVAEAARRRVPPGAKRPAANAAADGGRLGRTLKSPAVWRRSALAWPPGVHLARAAAPPRARQVVVVVVVVVAAVC